MGWARYTGFMTLPLGVGLSTLNKWILAHCDTDVVSDKDLDLARETGRQATTGPEAGAWISNTDVRGHTAQSQVFAGLPV